MPRLHYGLDPTRRGRTIEARRPSPSSRPASRSSRVAAWVAGAAAVVADAAWAQATAGDAGSTLWGAFKAVLYGPWGLVGSAVVVALGIYMFLERGFLHALAVMAAGGLIFFVPLIVVSMRNAAQAMGGAG
ncbi:MAG TPA: hypothetical protein VMU33_10375 [Burkholderiaceae bacterium]|nr:hypothetical protein [Burkholderiaceae bacterium]